MPHLCVCNCGSRCQRSRSPSQHEWKLPIEVLTAFRWWCDCDISVALSTVNLQEIDYKGDEKQYGSNAEHIEYRALWRLMASFIVSAFYEPAREVSWSLASITSAEEKPSHRQSESQCHWTHRYLNVLAFATTVIMALDLPKYPMCTENWLAVWSWKRYRFGIPAELDVHPARSRPNRTSP